MGAAGSGITYLEIGGVNPHIHIGGGEPAGSGSICCELGGSFAHWTNISAGISLVGSTPF